MKRRLNSIRIHNLLFRHFQKTFRNFTIVFLAFLSLNATAQSGNFISSKVENDIIVDKPADQVWALICNPENLTLLVPEVIKKVKINGEGIYTSWLISLQNDLLVKEEMIYFNAEDMEFAYIMTKTPMPLSDYLAIQKVEIISKNKSKITFTTYYNSNAQNRDNLQTTFANFQNTFLSNIKKIIE